MIWEIDEKTETIEGLDASGRPDPAYASALGLLRAPLGRRALAFVIDGGIWMLLQLPLWIGAVPLLVKFLSGSISAYGLVNHPDFVLAIVMASVSTLLSLVFLVVQLILHGLKGWTIGKRLVGVRSVNVRTLERPRVGAVLLRFLLVGVAGIVPVLGTALMLASPTFDPERRGRGLHDKATGLWLVDVRKGLNPYDEKRMRVARKMVKADPAPERSALPSLATPVDPSAGPAYRPGSRVSAGVLGVARPYDPDERPIVGLSLATPSTPAVSAEPVPGETGKPVLGGYRAVQAEREAIDAVGADALIEPLPADPAAPMPAMPRPAPGVVRAPSETPDPYALPDPLAPAAATAAPAPATPAPAAPAPATPAPATPAPLAPAAPVPPSAAAAPAPATPAPLPPAAPVPPSTAAAPAAPATPPAPVAPAPAASAPATPPAPVAPAPATSAPATPAPAAPTGFGLRLDTGESIRVDGPILLGRNPDATPHPGARAIPLPDDTRSLSKTHLLVRPVPGGLEVVDLHSTNGSALSRDGIDMAMPAGTVVAITAGDTIRLGDRVFAVIAV